METLAECLWKQRIEVMNRQIDRLKLRIEQQAINVNELTDHPSEARKARVTLQRWVAELSLLRQQRLNLYHRLAFVDGGWPGRRSPSELAVDGPDRPLVAALPRTSTRPELRVTPYWHAAAGAIDCAVLY